MTQTLRACVEAVAASLRDGEGIVEIRQGRMIFGRDARVPFLVEVATITDQGANASNPRGLIALVTPDGAQTNLVDLTQDSFRWVPL